MSNDKKIEIKADIVTKQSPDFQKIAHRAQAGLSESEVIERYTIGTYEKNKSEEEEEGPENK